MDVTIILDDLHWRAQLRRDDLLYLFIDFDRRSSEKNRDAEQSRVQKDLSLLLTESQRSHRRHAVLANHGPSQFSGLVQYRSRPRS